MLTLQEKQICPHSNNCPYNKNHSCMGASPERNNIFNCAYVVNGIISESGEQRNMHDATGNMTVIME